MTTIPQPKFKLGDRVCIPHLGKHTGERPRIITGIFFKYGELMYWTELEALTPETRTPISNNGWPEESIKLVDDKNNPD